MIMHFINLLLPPPLHRYTHTRRQGEDERSRTMEDEFMARCNASVRVGRHGLRIELTLEIWNSRVDKERMSYGTFVPLKCAKNIHM
jgi:hypothetical protein